jgi:hypothetical protein
MDDTTEAAFAFATALYNAGETVPNSLWRIAGVLSPPSPVSNISQKPTER